MTLLDAVRQHLGNNLRWSAEERSWYGSQTDGGLYRVSGVITFAGIHCSWNVFGDTGDSLLPLDPFHTYCSMLYAADPAFFSKLDAIMNKVETDVIWLDNNISGEEGNPLRRACS